MKTRGPSAGRAIVATLMVACLTAAAAVAATPAVPRPALGEASDVVPGQAVVRFAATASAAARAAALGRAGARPVRALLVRDHALVAIAGPLPQALRRLDAQRAIVRAEPNRLARIQLGSPNDPCTSTFASPPCPSVWHLSAIAAQPSWARYPGLYYPPASKLAIPAVHRVTVAVPDTAVQPSNVDFRNGGSSEDAALGGQLDIASMNGFAGLPPTSGPAAYHGTFVAGLVAASSNNSFASVGVGYHADLLPLAVVNSDTGGAETAKLADAIVYAHQRGARVINLSLGLLSPDGTVESAIRQVTTGPSPALVVAAAGNFGNNQPFYPAWFDNVLAVGGTDQSDRKASCSNWGPKISVVAPAKSVASITSDGFMVAPDCGTSAATPQVAGLAAALFAQVPSRTPAQVRAIIEQTADDLGEPGRDDVFGHGRINADRALGLGSGPQTSRLIATPVRANGGTSTVTAVATAATPVAAAEMFLNRLPADAADRGFPVGAADGVFDSGFETLQANFTAGSLAAGPHRVYVRARDASGTWGPLASAVMYADGVAPTIAQLQATNVVRPLDGASTITFYAADDYSPAINYDVEVTLAGQPGLRVWRAERIAGVAGLQRVTWTPRTIEAPGSYTVRVMLRDQVGNTVSAATTFLMV
ncbi:MAG TPA: S8 family serine peptidase [Actinomycetota bacterium]|nr:S8 family serine peptidase [Actinomycetota bacterium]